MGTIGFDDEPDSLEGYDVDEGSTGLPPEDDQATGPIPGYIPQPGDMIPDEALADTPALAEVEEDYGDVMDQVDRRMKVANYYRLILDNDLFSSDETSEARIAQGRIRKYVREELEVLLGMRKTAGGVAPAATFVNPFTDDEMTALKELARLALKKMRSEPQLKPIVAKAQPAAPQLKPIAPTAASVVPMIKKPAPVQAPRAAAPKPVPAAATQQRTAGVDPRIPEQYRGDPTAKVVNGKVFVQARDEDLRPIFLTHPRTKRKIPSMKDVTPVARPVGIMPVPMPSFAQMDQMQAIQAQNNVGVMSALAARNPNIAALAGAAALHLNGGPPQPQSQDHIEDALDGGERAF